jgi:hypothetical protein
MQSSGMWRRMDLVRTDVSKERITSIYRIEKIRQARNVCAGAKSISCSSVLWTAPYSVRKFFLKFNTVVAIEHLGPPSELQASVP